MAPSLPPSSMLLTAVALVTVTLAAAVSIVSIGPGLRISAPSEPPIAWLAVASAVLIFAGMLAGKWLYSRRIRALRRRQTARTHWEHSKAPIAPSLALSRVGTLYARASSRIIRHAS